MSKKTIRIIFILDDNADFRESTAWLLESMDYQVETFEQPAALIESLESLSDKVEAMLLLDIRIPIMSGLDVHDVLNRKGIAIPVVYMTAHGDVPIAVNAMSKGALAFLEKPLNENELERALKAAFSESVQIRRSVKANQDEFVRTRDRLGTLTRRESQVVQGILADLSNQQIASEFNISVKTVELYRSKVMNKLEAKNAAHLVRMVMTCAPA